MSKRKVSEKAIKRVNRNFTIAKVFLEITPVLAYLYLSIRAAMLSITLQELLTTEPSVAIIFLIAMINPYIAFLLDLMQKKLSEGNKTFVCINMVLLLVAELLTLNMFYASLLGYAFYSAIKVYDIKIWQELKAASVKLLFRFGGGSCIVMTFSTICLFATLRLR